MEKQLVEAALFMSPKPLKIEEIGRIAGISSLGYVRQLLEEIRKEYEGRGIEIIQTHEGWQMQARQDLQPKVSHLSPYADLSEGCKRTLALIAYREPVRQAEIIRIQGNKAYAYVKQLEKMGLVRGAEKGNTKILGLTKEFDAYFGQEKEKIKAKLASAFEQWQKSQAKKAGPDEAAVNHLEEAEHMAAIEKADAAAAGKDASDAEKQRNEPKHDNGIREQHGHTVVTARGEEKVKSVTVPAKTETAPSDPEKARKKARFEKEGEEIEEEQYL
ncbi:MAG: SMC-Scp complex subunit ScpB [Candidatus Aenigmarchaeota archaeon]|nr:SMC-Scp complex subunit ScpB [Candidatus Aenigmarchaeota archaeon]